MHEWLNFRLEEAFRLLQGQYRQDGEALWAHFESELRKRTTDIAERHKDEFHSLIARTKELEAAARATEQQKVHEIRHADRRVEDSLRQVAKLREENYDFDLEAELAKEINRPSEVIDDDSYVVHPFERHVSSLQSATAILRTLLWLLSRGDIGIGVFPERQKFFVAGKRPDARGVGIGSLGGS